MADDIDADTSEMDALARDLSALADIIPRKVRQAVQQTAIKGKDFWQADASVKASRSTAGYPGSIDYELKGSVIGGGTVEGEVGPNLSRGGKTGKGGLQPSLGILEEAPGGVRAAPRQSIRRAYTFIEEELDKGVDIAIKQSEEARGL
ncbi:MAG: hypothetical protein EPO52_17640 [Herbiconiux sp.]|uniref:hypothetical protein n=1 Tax=Herbiconiux sp. TaxID=1871186 RepID=UPI00120E58F3|nr:hypothetical protein [Herbiconiux sp.]TAJ46356.1 MAG: hypothetical protein EPO52_17640 [Herbiconiux sp.]